MALEDDHPQEEPRSSPSTTVLDYSTTAITTPSSSFLEPTFSKKPKRPPTVTPNSFRRFFTPSSRLSRASEGRSYQILREITSNNQATQRSQDISRQDNAFQGIENITPSSQSSKKRKVAIFDQSSPIKPGKRRTSLSPRSILRPKRVQRPLQEQQTSQIFERSFNLRSCPSTSNLRVVSNDWRVEVEDFSTVPEDLYSCQDSDGFPAVPFSASSSNTTSLVAFGKEDGHVSIVDTALDARTKFNETFLELQCHRNAVIDVCFSKNDHLLATASADVTAVITDLPKQKVVNRLLGHTASLKRIQFQPGVGASNIVATACRDGCVMIWDLRLKSTRPAHTIMSQAEAPSSSPFYSQNPATAALCVNEIEQAHGFLSKNLFQPRMVTRLSSKSSKLEKTQNHSDYPTVTAMTFLPEGREHLLVTACGTNTKLRLWDLRTVYTNRNDKSVPVSETAVAMAGPNTRQFGTNALVMNSSGSRIFSLARDNSIYAFSTNHLVTGMAQDVDSPSGRPRPYRQGNQAGLRPLYALQHPKLRTSTFFVNMALRKTSDDCTELLATGSSDGNPVVFPTDERYTYHSHRGNTEHRMFRYCLPGHDDGIVPVYRVGSALIRGHQNEVTHVAWTHDGALTSVSDDLKARCWRQGPKARDLRTGGEDEGRRWNCGWAEAGLPDEEAEDLD